MTPQERDVLTPLLDKLRQTQVPDKDAEADQLIRQTLQAQPDGAYILAQTVLMQDYALHAAQDRIHALEQQQSSSAPSSGGFLGGLFGGGRPAQPAQGGPWGTAPQQSSYGPQIASAVQLQYGQPSFLRGAAQTAAGIAGGALLFQGLEGLFGGRGGGFGGGMGGGFLGGGFGQQGIVENTEVVNNYYDQPAQADQGSDDISDQGNFDTGGGDDSFNT